MNPSSRSHKRPLLTALAAAVLLAALAAGHETLATGRLSQTVPTRTPAYTLPPGPTHTPVPDPSDTPDWPQATSTPPANTATLPAATPPPGSITSPPGSATPMPTPASEASQPPLVATSAVTLSCAADISRQDVLTGEEVEYAVLVTSPGTRHASNVALREIIASGIELLRISATQGVVDVDEQTVTLRFGTLEPGQSALAILDLRVSPSASVGQIFVLRGTAYFDGGAVTCNPVAFAMPPSRLPGTGSSRATP